MRFLEIDSYMTALTTLMTFEQSPRHMGKGMLSQGKGEWVAPLTLSLTSGNILWDFIWAQK